MTVSTPQPSAPAWQEEALPLPGPGTPVPAAPPPAGTEPTTAMPAFLGADGKPLRPAKPATPRFADLVSFVQHYLAPATDTRLGRARGVVPALVGAPRGRHAPQGPVALVGSATPAAGRHVHVVGTALRPPYASTARRRPRTFLPLPQDPHPPAAAADRNPATGLALRACPAPRRSLRCPTNRSTTTSASLRLMLSLTCMASWTASRGSPWPPAMR